jgi:hypothetical protein
VYKRQAVLPDVLRRHPTDPPFFARTLPVITAETAATQLRESIALRRRLAASANYQIRQLQLGTPPGNYAPAFHTEVALLTEVAELLLRPPAEVRSRDCKAEREAAETLRTLNQALGLVK